MALDYIFGDTFDTRGFAEAARRYTSGSASGLITGANTRHNYGQAFSGVSALRKDFGTNYRYWSVAAAFKYTGALGAFTMLTIMDVANTQAHLRVQADGSLIIVDQAAAQVGAASTAGIFSSATWHHVALLLDIGNSGAAHIYLDGVLVLSVTGDLQGGANQYAKSVVIASGGASLPQVDDFYVMAGNSTTSLVTEFGGDLSGSFYMPTADAVPNDWTPSAGSDNYAMVDEIPPDDNTTYLTAATATDSELYTIPDLESFVGEIKFVQQSFMGQQDSGSTGPQTIANQNKIGATTTDLGTDHVLSAFGSILEFEDARSTDPTTGLAWTSAAFNGMSVGIVKKS